jgi:hypothetical protein
VIQLSEAGNSAGGTGVAQDYFVAGQSYQLNIVAGGEICTGGTPALDAIEQVES